MEKAKSVSVAVIAYEDETVRRYTVKFDTFTEEYFQTLRNSRVDESVIIGLTDAELSSMFPYVVYEGGLCASDFE